jgi:hypothetical protein
MIGMSVYRPTKDQSDKTLKLNAALNKLTLEERALLFASIEETIRASHAEPPSPAGSSICSAEAR